VTPDQINALFEAGGTIAVGLSIRQVLIDRDVQGVSIWQVLFFLGWGFWNLYFYPSVGQPWSFWAGVALAIANTIYVGCLVYFICEES
jgi:hypothetical protein